MGRPQPNAAMSAGTEQHSMGPTKAEQYPPTKEDNHSVPAEAYKPAVPYPPQQTVHDQVVDGTPVMPFPPVEHTVTPQHNVHVQNINIGEPWSTGLFQCDLNETNAVMTAFFPCVTFGQIAEILDEGQTKCTLGSFMYILMVPALLSCWVIGSSYRKKLRQKYSLVEAPYEDWAVHLFCPCCALCQEYRELEKRGFDPSLGWMGHLAKQQQQTQTAPPMNQFMNR